MTGMRLALRERALKDIDEAVDHYFAQGGERLALRLIDALEAAFRSIEARPGAGSTRYSYELGLPGLRTRRVGRFPYLIFYVEAEDHIDVWRVLHGQRDIPELIRAPDR